MQKSLFFMSLAALVAPVWESYLVRVTAENAWAHLPLHSLVLGWCRHLDQVMRLAPSPHDLPGGCLSVIDSSCGNSPNTHTSFGQATEGRAPGHVACPCTAVT